MTAHQQFSSTRSRIVKLRYIAVLIAVTIGATWVVAQETLPGGAPAESAAPAVQGAPAREAPPTDARHYSYALGLDLGTSFRNDKLPLDVDSMLAGVRDGLEGKDPQRRKAPSGRRSGSSIFARSAPTGTSQARLG